LLKVVGFRSLANQGSTKGAATHLSEERVALKKSRMTQSTEVVAFRKDRPVRYIAAWGFLEYLIRRIDTT